MKKLLLISAATILVSCSQESDSKGQQTVEDCNCKVEHWLRIPVPNQMGVFTWELIYAEPIEFDCINDVSGVFYPAANANYNQDKIVCEELDKK